MATFIRTITTSHGIVTSATAAAIAGADLPNSGVTPGTFNNVTVDTTGRVTVGSNVFYLTGNQTITLSGDVTGSGATAIATALATLSPNPAGSYTNLSATVDSKGRVTAAASGAAGTTQVIQNKTANYSAVAGDLGSLLNFALTSGSTLTLGTQAAGWWVDVINSSATSVLLALNYPGSIDGQSAVNLTANTGVHIVSLGGGNYTLRRSAPTNTNGTVTLGGTVTVTATPALVGGMVISFPSAGTYLVVGTIRALIASSTGISSLTAKLRDVSNGVDVAGPFFLVLGTSAVAFAENGAALTAIITVTGPVTVQLWAFLGGSSVSSAQIATDANGGTFLTWTRLA